MKRKILSMLLVVSMVGIMFTGCNTKEESKENSTVKSDKDISTDFSESASVSWSDNPYILVINNEEYYFPMSYGEFLSKGWDSADELHSTKDLGEMTLSADYVGKIFLGGGGTVYKIEGVEGAWLHLYNGSNSDKCVKDCDVVGLSYDENLKDKKITPGTIKIRGNGSEISIGESTKSDVDEAFGSPTNSILTEDDPNTIVNEYKITYMYTDEEDDWLLHLYFDSNEVLTYFVYESDF